MNKCKHRLRSVLLLLLALCMIPGGMISCISTSPDDGYTTTEAPITDGPPTYFSITEDTVIVRSDANEDYVEAAQILQAKIEALTGIRPGLRNDSSDVAASEILIGETTREIAQTFYKDITIMDYGYLVLSEGCVAVAGGSVETTLKAIDYFLENAYGFTGEGTGEVKELLVSSGKSEKYRYPVKKLTLDGNPISDYTILYDSGNGFRAAAQTIANAIESKTGISLPVAKLSAGASTPHTLTLKNDTSLGAYAYTYEIKDGDLMLTLSGTGSARIGDSFPSVLLPDDAKGQVNISATDGPVKRYGFKDNESYNYTLIKTTDKTNVCPGVKRYTNHYKDRNGNPVVAYIIEAKKGAVTLQMGTADAEYKIAESQVLDQIMAEQRVNGTDVCAAVNGCLYAWDNDMNWYRPEGLNIKDGQLLGNHNSDLYQSFVLKKDGTYYMGNTPGVINPADVQLSIGGWWLLLKDGDFVSESDMGLKFDGGSFALTRHPRTAIGFKEDGTILLIVVDGRQPEHSNGATTPDLAIMFKELGCVDAINIDGGGSSISYTKDYKTGQFKYWNIPNAGNGPRKTLNSTLLIRNPDYVESKD